MLIIYIDADACPVKEEVYKVAGRYKLQVVVVSNRPIHTPMQIGISTQVVGDALDAADDWIVENIHEKDILITADILLADRALKKGARVLGPKGGEFTEDSIGEAVAAREILSYLRDTGGPTPKNPPFEQRDRSQFLSTLDQIVQALRRLEHNKKP